MLQSIRQFKKYERITGEELEAKMSTASTIASFTKKELLKLADPMKDKLKSSGYIVKTSMNKPEIVNCLSKWIGDGSSIRRKSCNPQTLRMIVKSYLKTKLSKDVINAAYATYKFPEYFEDWRNKCLFKDDCKIEGTENPPFWYAQPKLVENDSKHILNFLDPEHLLTNMRTKVCSTGIPESNISRKAWVDVALNGKSNGSDLSIALVEHLTDKQNVGFALKTFSEEVEKAMITLGYIIEADFCRLFRNWYRAQDEPGLSALERHNFEQELRRWLLKDVTFNEFPPYGMHVKGIPVVLFEGLLIHIDRRAQLYVFTEKGTYNPRAIGTLDNENFFGAFQDWDAKGTGVLRANEIPIAMSTACELYHTRLNPDRGFFMHTSGARVYPTPELNRGTTMENEIDRNACFPNKQLNPECIPLRDHAFDKSERKRENRKRKRGTINDLSQPARGTKGVRHERYSINESKILHHIRAGITLPDEL